MRCAHTMWRRWFLGRGVVLCLCCGAHVSWSAGALCLVPPFRRRVYPVQGPRAPIWFRVSTPTRFVVQRWMVAGVWMPFIFSSLDLGDVLGRKKGYGGNAS